jgi:plasmid maintenance system antidote protein VapI
MTIPKPATATQIAKYGRVAALLRQYMTDHKLDRSDLSQKLGYTKHAGHIYNWYAAKGGPGPEARVKLAKLFGNSPEAWQADNLTQSKPAITPTTKPTAPDRILNFSMLANGQAKLQLDLTGDAEQLKTLLTHILQLRLT